MSGEPQNRLLQRWLPLGFSVHGFAGVLLIATAWPASWLHMGILGQYAFFPLWLGYILLADAVVFRRRGNSIITHRPLEFCGMFLASVPIWWTFEVFNTFTQNWHYLGGEQYSSWQYALVASWHFSIVVPAVFETASLVGTFNIVERFRQRTIVVLPSFSLIGLVGLGILSLGATVLWPTYAFSLTWLCLVLILDPINYRLGAPSIIVHLQRGDWRILITFGIGALICGWFWEMWNFWAYAKWEYSIPFVGFVHLFEMPLLGYGGYLPFGLEVFTAYHFLKWASLRIIGAKHDLARLSKSASEPS